MHEAPPVPQVAGERGLHVTPEQQPLAQDVASQTQRPPTQCCPPAHSGPVPHEHPFDEHPSERLASHAMHAAPAVPQVANDDARHCVPEQHPLGHAHVEQAPAPQESPAGHAVQAWPAAPHAAGSFPVRQVAPSQHPLGQEVASQTQLPPSQR